MNLVRQNGPRIVIKQIPLALLGVTALFSLPFLAFSLIEIGTRTFADGTIFCLFFGILMLWVFLEFVATRERIEIDQAGRVLTRRVNGVFRRKTQVIDLNDIKEIGVEIKIWENGTKHRRLQYLYLYGARENFLINNPSKVTIDQAKMGRMLSGFTLIPYNEKPIANQS